ncbi:MAG: DUF429 domain-containing protein [Deltaproteobacteria bacterium]|nr:DUF429 domain-containing protein [Deltaproteobacteria bacterium]
MYLVGIDCATKPRDVGIALAEMGDPVEVLEIYAGDSNPWGRVIEWVLNFAGQDVLVALDAPLGWPIALSEALHEHSAGNPVGNCPNDMFRRSTDRDIHNRLGKQPLDVGANRIARTAHAALKELEFLRESTDNPIPLAWCHDNLGGVQAIEVYPAATLKSHCIRCDRYKRKNNPDHRRGREEIARSLPGVSFAGDCWDAVIANADALDAAVCVLAAADFVRGDATQPPNIDVASREGWIWCRAPNCSSARA